MPEFAVDHPIAILRGRRIPDVDEVRTQLAKRCAWLEHRIRLSDIEKRPAGLFIAELKAMAALGRILDEVHPPLASDTDRPPPASEEPSP